MSDISHNNITLIHHDWFSSSMNGSIFDSSFPLIVILQIILILLLSLFLYDIHTYYLTPFYQKLFLYILMILDLNQYTETRMRATPFLLHIKYIINILPILSFSF